MGAAGRMLAIPDVRVWLCACVCSNIFSQPLSQAGGNRFPLAVLVQCCCVAACAAVPCCCAVLLCYCCCAAAEVDESLCMLRRRANG